MIATAIALALAASPTPTLSQTEADTLGPRELAVRLFPELAPEDAVHATTHRGRFTPPGALGSVAVFSRPTDLGDGLCRTVRHQRRARHKVGQEAREAPVPTAATSMPLDAPEALALLLMLPVSEDNAPAARCADQDPGQFFGLGSPQMEPDVITASRLLRTAVASGVSVPYRCFDRNVTGKCDDPAAALKTLAVDKVEIVRSETAPFCQAMTSETKCLMFVFKDSAPWGTWMVKVTMNKGELAGLQLDRGVVVYD